jgi:hypothetical protein
MAKFQRINENVFKLMPEAQAAMSAEEVAATWKDDENGEYICVLPDENRAYYCAHRKVMEEIPVRYGNIWSGINVWMDAHGFYPNIWSANDHGNLTLWNRRGKPLGGLV